MKKLLTTREAADEISGNPFVPGKVIEWQVRRLFEDGDLSELPKFGGKRMINEEMLPEIVSALVARGWIPKPSASSQGAKR